MWKGVNPIRRGVNYYRWKNLTDDGTIVNGIFIVDGIFDSTLRWDGLFKKLCELYEGFWGCLHIVTDHEGRLSPNGVVRSDYCLPIRSGAYSARSIPNLTCLNFIRDDMVDPEIWPRIEAAGFPVERFLDGHLLQVTPGFDDLLTDFPNFSRRRAEHKTFFPPDLFLIKDEPPLSD
jgi:hypothetical protein